MYADLAYCAALNLWTLRDREVADFKLERADFHEWAVTNPTEFGKVTRVALEALTNKSLEELLNTNKEADNANEDALKKKSSLSIIQRLRRFWSAIVG